MREVLFIPAWFVITAEFFVPWPLNIMLGVMLTVFAIPAFINGRKPYVRPRPIP